ncbi:phage head closure protein [Inquilinus sp. CA228]|uniref:phage head closure protein n=1 Tax=Inquilinus sp. CA228 TaxID=3455609 RepID=UPI003F8D2DAF
MIRGGEMRARCRFERPVPQKSAAGNAYNGWVEACTVWGWLKPMSGREAVKEGRLEATSTGTLRVQAGPKTRPIDASHRVWIKGRVYVIRGLPIDTEQRGQEIDFVIEAGVAS